ncbi:hypothetical protein K439DRAFT_1413052 [Ramaria rubella]|nr:hypothetical protein K439DRAFT_1413052 [Ramaria rubella]
MRSLNPSAVDTAQIWDPNTGDACDDATEQSLYVRVFQNIQDIVMEQENFLFSPEEQATLRRLKAMSYPARYLLIRLSLCKRDKWHSLASLEHRYKIEIGGKDHISCAINELCGIVTKTPIQSKVNIPEIIDLTLEEDFHSQVLYAEDDSTATLPDLLDCLTHDELKQIGRQMKVIKSGQNRSDLMAAILSFASKQSTFASPSPVLSTYKRATRRGEGPIRQLTLDFFPNGKMKDQTNVVRQLASKAIGRCIRILPSIFTLFDRLHIVFFRSTAYDSLFLPALLSAFRKHNHVDINYCRTTSIFKSRRVLLDYQEALILEAHFNDVLSGRACATTQRLPNSLRAARTKDKAKHERSLASSRVEGAKAAREIWPHAYDCWKTLGICKDESVESLPSLERFTCGHVYTRIVSQGAEMLAILKEYELEAKVLNELLAQDKWLKGRRGAWYDRLALVLMTHFEQTPDKLGMAMDVVIQGLKDELTCFSYRPRLERRLTRLEKKLKIPMEERHKCDGKLKKAHEVYIEGNRVKNRAGSVVLAKTYHKSNQPSERCKPEDLFAEVKASMQTPQTNSILSCKGKTLWTGNQGEEISVEQFALEYYQQQGYNGFHTEGRIVSTIFGLLFWDVIFDHTVPGAFETPYQSAPLDMLEDVFYLARKSKIDERLRVLEEGGARGLLEQVLAQERPRHTRCIGVDWDFEPKDLMDIVECLGGHSLAVICRSICQNHGQRRGGVPDLFVWNTKTKECRFVEVKSPNDTLQENQKVWIDILLCSETLVDLCHVAEKGEKGKKKRVSQVANMAKDTFGSSDIDSEGSEDEDPDSLKQSSTMVVWKNKRTRNSDDFVPPPTKKRK